MTYTTTQIGFIGGGNMAYAIISGLLNSGHSPECIAISEPNEAQRNRLLNLHAQLRVSTDNGLTAKNSAALVIAVKPQIVADVAAQLLESPPRVNDQLIVSIAAGITLKSLGEMFAPTRSIVRIMPNQPALVGAGMSVLTPTAQVSDAQRKLANYIAEAMGQAEWLDDEKLMDAVTAVSGSGPAYFYLLMELLEASARDMGLPAPLARTLSRQTGFGAGKAAAESELELTELRESVTSKGGTTAAALAAFEQAGIRDIVARALRAARDRSSELGQAQDSGKTKDA